MGKGLKILYTLFYFSIPKSLLKKWIQKRKINVLTLVAKKGNYKNRIFIANNLDPLRIEYQWKLLKILLNDSVEVISKKMIDIYEFHYLPGALTVLILDRKKYWQEKRIADVENSERVSNLLKNTKQYKRKFSDGETFKNVKKMLQKPLNIGKWF